LTELYIVNAPIRKSGVQAISRLQQLTEIHVKRRTFFGGAINVDISCFAEHPAIVSLALVGTFQTSQGSFDKLQRAKPELEIYCTVK
jgi:hypothetical protein